MLTARQKELLRSLPRDISFNISLARAELGDWIDLAHHRLLTSTNFARCILTPAGQAEWDKLQETEASK